MQKILRIVLFLSALLVGGCAHAQDQEALPPELLLNVPSGFVGPERIKPDPDSETIAYSRDRPEGEVRTLLQITIIDAGKKLREIPRDKRAVATEYYLFKFLEGIERRRTEYTESEPTTIDLGGYVASRATWNGLIDGHKAHGVMYAVIVESKLYILHTQDSADAPPEDMDSAIHSIESLVFKRNG